MVNGTCACAKDVIVMYNLLRQEIAAIEMALEAVRLYAKGEGRHDKLVQEALLAVEKALDEINDDAERVLRVHTRSGGRP